MRFVSASSFSASSEAGSGWEDWERRGTIYYMRISKVNRERVRKSPTYGDTRMASDNWNNNLRRLGSITGNLGNEGRCAHNIQRRYTEEPFRQSVLTLVFHPSRGDTA